MNMGDVSGGQASPLLHFVVSNWLSIAFGAVGFVGSVYTFLSWHSGRKQQRAYRYLFELAERNIEKDITEHQLAEKHEAIAQASRRIEALQEKIRREIPLAAKRAVLMDRLRSQSEILHQHYESVLSLRNDLQAIGSPVDIPDELLRAVELHIEPDYFLREKRSRFKTNLSILTAGSAVASAVLPYPTGRFVSLALLVLAVPILLGLTRLAIRERLKTGTATRDRLLVGAGIVVSAFLFIFGVGFLTLAVAEPPSTEFTGPFGIGLLGLSIVLTVVTVRRRKQLKRSLDRARGGSGAAPHSDEKKDGEKTSQRDLGIEHE